MAGCKREVMEPSGREKVAAAAALVAGLVGMWFMLAYSYVYILSLIHISEPTRLVR